MKLGRGSSSKSKPVALPERTQTVTLVPARGETIPARAGRCLRLRRRATATSAGCASIIPAVA